MIQFYVLEFQVVANFVNFYELIQNKVVFYTKVDLDYGWVQIIFAEFGLLCIIDSFLDLGPNGEFHADLIFVDLECLW